MPDVPARLLDGHTADWHGESRPLSCSCGDATGYVAHIAALLGTDDVGARGALLAAHNNVGVNAGLCGGCDTCGSATAAIHCPVCGDADHPCLTYFVAAGRGPTDATDIEGMK